jgi:enediyne biosynthesis protein E4
MTPRPRMVGGPALLAALGLGALALAPAGCNNDSISIAAPTATTKGTVTAAPDIPSPRATAPANPTIPQEPSPFRFAEVAKQAGVDFVHVSGMTPEKHFPTANGSGAAILDFDGDGKMDIYFANGTLLPVGSKKTGPNRLYRNLGGGKFEDATARSGLGFEGFCHGIIVGDVDNDGDQDVILCNFGPNVLYLNNGDGTFRDVSKESGIGRDGWSSGGAFLDYDGDGDLDVYITNYGEWVFDRDAKEWCGDAEKKVRTYCSPKKIPTVKHFFYRNDGLKGGVPHFTDVYDEVFVDDKGKKIPGRSDGHGFGVVAADLNGDGKIDLYVANDQNPNFTFLNRGDGTFEDATERSGAAYDDKGKAQSGMGVDAADIDGDGKPELIVTNFKDEYNTVYQNLGEGLFFDQTPSFGMVADAMPWVGWGVALADFDNDGWPDCFVTNGHVDDNLHLMGQDTPYEEPPLLHRNVPLGNGPGRRFKLATRGAGPYFESTHVGRGAAFGDLDDDGRLDIVVNHKGGAAAVLLNQTPQHDNRWVRLKLVGTRSNRDAVGARIEVVVGDRTIHRQRKGGCSMESAHDPRVLIGLGPVSEVAKLTIHWPAGGPDTVLEHLKVNQTYEVVEPKDAK